MSELLEDKSDDSSLYEIDDSDTDKTHSVYIVWSTKQ